MELLNGMLSSMSGRNFTEATLSTTADALAFLHTLKKEVEEDISGKFENDHVLA